MGSTAFLKENTWVHLYISYSSTTYSLLGENTHFLTILTLKISFSLNICLISHNYNCAGLKNLSLKKLKVHLLSHPSPPWRAESEGRVRAEGRQGLACKLLWPKQLDGRRPVDCPGFSRVRQALSPARGRRRECWKLASCFQLHRVRLDGT